MIPDTNVGGNIATINEVSDEQKTMIFYVGAAADPGTGSSLRAFGALWKGQTYQTG